MPQTEPLLSVVVTSRNDDHGGTLLRRMQTFTNAFIGQCRRHGLSAELIIVEWNPVTDRVKLAEALRWPADLGPCEVRIIEVPPEVHARHAHSAALPLFQMIAKNVGIRRARGKYVVATNIDILLSDEMVRHIMEGNLRTDRMYRVDRMDVMTHVPVDASVEEQLAYCRSHFLRRNAREGTYRLQPDGSPAEEPGDVFVAESGVFPEAGFYPLERMRNEPVRWVAPEARFQVTAPTEGAGILTLEVEPGPASNFEPVEIHVCDAAGNLVARAHVECRQLVWLRLPLAPGQTGSFSLRVPQNGPPRGLDPRNLAVALFRCAWASRPTPTVVGHPNDWNCVVTEAGSLYPEDAADRGDGIRFGKGCHHPEVANGASFRWVGPLATLLVTPPADGPSALCLELKDGPALVAGTLDLEVFNESGTLLARASMRGRTRLFLRVPGAAEESQPLTLRVCGEIRPVPGETRSLCYRLCRCSWAEPAAGGMAKDCVIEEVCELEAEDVAGVESGVRFGRGFYSVEKSGEQRFRWVADQATLLLTAPVGARALTLDLEPGPYASHEAVDLTARDDAGTILAQGSVEGRERVCLALPVRAGVQQRIHLEACPRRAADVPRQLALRLFHCDWADSIPAGHQGLNFVATPKEASVGWDAVAAQRPVGFGRGWYPREHYQGEVFHWGKSGAVLHIPSGGGRHLSLLLEPARPEGKAGPVALELRDERGQVLGRAAIEGRQVVRFPVPRGGSRTVTLHAAAEPVCRVEDPRTLSFRVLLPEQKPSTRPAARARRLLGRLWDQFRGRKQETEVAAPSDTVAALPDGLPADPGTDYMPEVAPHFLHCNACGDFTLLSLEKWFELRAYPEPEIFSLHIDSLFCYQAHCAGVLEEMIPDPMQVYHIEHSEGSGWTPEGAEKLMKRINAKGIPVLDCGLVFRWAAQMRETGKALVFNGENWGLANDVLPETVLSNRARMAA